METPASVPINGNNTQVQSIWGARSLSQSLSAETVTTVIVCPTPAGGHIEHACDLALATLAATGREATLLTRSGAVDYLLPEVLTRVHVREIIPSLIPSVENPSAAQSIARPLRQLLELVREHWRIRKAIQSIPGKKVLVLEEPRYPFPRILKDAKNRTSVCLMLHNVVEHEAPKRSLPYAVKSQIASRVRRKVDRIAVHGDRQLDLVRQTVDTPARSFPLPGDSYLAGLTRKGVENPSAFDGITDSFVCLGEIRENKGIELAIAAAIKSGLRLVVVGKVIDSLYLESLRQASDGAPNILIRDEFLSPVDFEYIMSNCLALVLPYSHFGAQSGVLARAMRKPVWAIASDLPSLREQALGSENVVFFEQGSSESLSEKMREVKAKEVPSVGVDVHVSSENNIAEWNEIAHAIQVGW